MGNEIYISIAKWGGGAKGIEIWLQTNQGYSNHEGENHFGLKLWHKAMSYISYLKIWKMLCWIYKRNWYLKIWDESKDDMMTISIALEWLEAITLHQISELPLEYTQLDRSGLMSISAESGGIFRFPLALVQESCPSWGRAIPTRSSPTIYCTDRMSQTAQLIRWLVRISIDGRMPCQLRYRTNETNWLWLNENYVINHRVIFPEKLIHGLKESNLFLQVLLRLSLIKNTE